MNLYLPGCPDCLKYCRANFQSGFHGFRATAKRLDVVQIFRRNLAKAFHEIEGDIRNSVQGWRERHPLHLLTHGFHNAWMAVSQDATEDTPNRVEVAFPFHVPIVESFCSFDHNRMLQELGRRLVIDERTLN